MTELQKVIKYAAIALAIFLIVCIISVAINITSGIIYLVTPEDSTETVKDSDVLEVNETKNIELDLASVSLVLKEGDSFKIRTDSSHIETVQKNNGKLIIKEDDHSFLSVNKASKKLIIEVPEGFEFDTFELESGAGVIDIDGLTAKKADFDFGAGEVVIKNINVKNEADIEGGAGKITIKGVINSLELEMGVGELNLETELKSKSNIEFGIGNANVILIGDKEDYALNINKGIGNVTVDGSSLKEYTVSANQKAAKVTMDCGVGNIDISFN